MAIQKMLKPNIQLQRSAFTKKLYKWGKFLPQRTVSNRHEEDYLHKKNLEMFFLKMWMREREITLLFLGMFLKTHEKHE